MFANIILCIRNRFDLQDIISTGSNLSINSPHWSGIRLTPIYGLVTISLVNQIERKDEYVIVESLTLHGEYIPIESFELSSDMRQYRQGILVLTIAFLITILQIDLSDCVVDTCLMNIKKSIEEGKFTYSD